MRHDLIFAAIAGLAIAYALWAHAVFAQVHRESIERQQPWVDMSRRDNLR